MGPATACSRPHSRIRLTLHNVYFRRWWHRRWLHSLASRVALLAVPRRIEIELTSQRDDGTWTWRAAGARRPKGEVSGDLVPDATAVGSVLKAEVDGGLDGLEITALFAPRARPESSGRLELIGGGAGPLVTTALVPGSRRHSHTDRDSRRDGAAPSRERQGTDGGAATSRTGAAATRVTDGGAATSRTGAAATRVTDGGAATSRTGAAATRVTDGGAATSRTGAAATRVTGGGAATSRTGATAARVAEIAIPRTVAGTAPIASPAAPTGPGGAPATGVTPAPTGPKRAERAVRGAGAATGDPMDRRAPRAISAPRVRPARELPASRPNGSIDRRR